MPEMMARLYLRLPDELDKALEIMAKRRFMKKPDTARLAIAKMAQEDGIEFTDISIVPAPNGSDEGEPSREM